MDEDQYAPPLVTEEFQRLERQARLLVWAVFVLVLLIALVPPVLSSIFRIEKLREHVNEEAAHTARLTTAYVRNARIDFKGLQQAVSEEGSDVTGWIRVVDLRGTVVVQTGSFQEPRLVPVEENGEIMDVRIEYLEDFPAQMVEYDKQYSFLPHSN